MKSVLISIKPQWCEKIASGKKTIEVRKSAPKETPFKCYIYATKPKKFYKCGPISTSDELLWLANGKVEMGDGFKFWANGDEYQGLNGRVIGEFICNKLDKYTFSSYEAEYRVNHIEQEMMCLNHPDLIRYGVGETLYGLHISGLKIYDKPKELNEFERPCSYKGTCYYCARAKFESDGTLLCNTEINRAPQSWCYVEELKEKQK